MAQQLALTDDDLAPVERGADKIQVFAPDLAFRTFSIVNVIFFGLPGEGSDWVLIDTGLPTSAGAIRACAENRFGLGTRPRAIIMTHAHFDHAGSVEQLSQEWDVPVYAHPLEEPYLRGQASYPPADPMVGGGAMALLSPLFPRSPVDVSSRLQMLPIDHGVPGMPGWRWLHTPGHSPGHISLFRDSDRTLIAGDAVVTTAQESVYAVMTQKPEIHGPPRYLTPNWIEAEQSVQLLAGLEPELIVTGHGLPVRGAGMRARLHELAENFRAVAVPQGGTYDLNPANPGKSDNDAYR
ncbi:MBL fold metallo-hydrolase [Xaviernesmea oryzae]|uniref:MBL fold metallo-hydrolase n=1 Tax=Xaviernesmea oryzae TaxID=464029 RepID=A0A1Q9B155_9HYPH|nr:MBL fold metallo-hydrolase [Xaviernesmea oryzae]OLP61715.1 MBL fold metallo-hydrolase [Xaviernesmea oryzae]SEL01321.1 Glyoxylase, beta-lactamase superfamily II [Xaviernesmea oryzae]